MEVELKLFFSRTMNVEQSWLFLLIYFYYDRELNLNQSNFFIAAVAVSIGGCTDAGVSLICAGIAGLG